MITFTANDHTYLMDKLTIENYYDISDLDTENPTMSTQLEVLSIISGCPGHILKGTSSIEFMALWNLAVERTLNVNPKAILKQRIRVGDEDLKFININQLSIGEYIDIDIFLSEGKRSIHKVLAILYRPEGEAYDAMKAMSRFDELMKLPMEVALGALNFFTLIVRDCTSLTIAFLEQQIRKEKPAQMKELLGIARDSRELLTHLYPLDGTISSGFSLERIHSNLMKLQASVSTQHSDGQRGSRLGRTGNVWRKLICKLRGDNSKKHKQVI